MANIKPETEEITYDIEKIKSVYKGITPEQITQFKDSMKEVAIFMNKTMVTIGISMEIAAKRMKAIGKLINKINEQQNGMLIKPKGNKKGKNLKCWENKKFYQ